MPSRRRHTTGAGVSSLLARWAVGLAALFVCTPLLFAVPLNISALPPQIITLWQRHVPEATVAQSQPEQAQLLAALRAAPSDAMADAVAGQLWQMWSATTSPTVSALMARAAGAQEAGNSDLALRMLDAVITVDPTFAEAYNRRATLRYDRGLQDAALADLNACLQHNPNHFGAWVSAGAVFEDMGADEAALRAYGRALDIYPRLPDARAGWARLTLRRDGRAA